MTFDTETAVQSARQLCERNAAALPANAGINTILRFAAQTTSRAEIGLFLDYQGARDDRDLARCRPFFKDLKNQLAARDEPIADTRRFLKMVRQVVYVLNSAARLGRQEGPRGDAPPRGQGAGFQRREHEGGPGRGLGR